MRFIFASKLTYALILYYSHALVEDLKIFDNFDHIFTLLLSFFRPLTVCITPLGQKLLLQVFDQPIRTQQETMWLTTPLGSI